MSNAKRPIKHVFVTGATGSLGHRVVVELLGKGIGVTALVRGPVERSSERLLGLLDEVGIHPPVACTTPGGVPHEPRKSDVCTPPLLRVVSGALAGEPPDLGWPGAAAIVHIAAATNFKRNAAGDPERTNVEGTRRVLKWASLWKVGEVHLVSSAYACGRRDCPVPESFDPTVRSFHNDYERSKWEAERLCLAWGRGAGRRVTVYRPSIIVGDSVSGRTTKFDGFYLSARATELLDRVYRGRTAKERRSIPLRIRGRADDRQNIVPVDYVARMITRVVATESYQGRVYHLVHPAPPSNGEIKAAFEDHFKIGGGRFVAPERFDETDLNEHEQQFCDVTRPIAHYFVDSPSFVRSNAASVERAEGIACAPFDAEAINRLVRYAQSVGWKSRGRPSVRDGSFCARYFESFLPSRVARSQVAEMTAVSATVRFVIEDEPNGEWTCRFERGALMEVRRGKNGVREDFGYRTSRDVFCEAIRGQVHPQEFFLTGRAEIFGDVERALKMAMILHAFTNEFPCEVGTAAHVE